MLLFCRGALLALIQIVFTSQAMGAGTPPTPLSESKGSIWVEVNSESGLITSLPAVDDDGLLEQMKTMRTDLQLQKEELARVTEDRKFKFKDGLITVVMPGGLLYAAVVKQRHEQAKKALDNVTIRLAELTQEIIEFGYNATGRSLLAGLD